MALYDYNCEHCGVFTKMLPISSATTHITCDCGRTAKKVVTAPNVISSSGGSSLKKEMSKMNEDAGKRMKGRNKPVELVALDYGNGDVRGVK